MKRGKESCLRIISNMFSLATKYWTNSAQDPRRIINPSLIPSIPRWFWCSFANSYKFPKFVEKLSKIIIRATTPGYSREKCRIAEKNRDCRLRCLADKWPKKKKKEKKSPPSPIYTGVSRPSRIIKTLPPPCCASFHNPVVASSDKRHCSCEAAQPNNCLIDAAQLSWIAYLLHRLPFTLPCTSLTSPQLLFRREIRFPSNPSQSTRCQNYSYSWKTIHPVCVYARQRCANYPSLSSRISSKLFINARRLVWNRWIEKLICHEE